MTCGRAAARSGVEERCKQHPRKKSDAPAKLAACGQRQEPAEDAADAGDLAVEKNERAAEAPKEAANERG